MKPIIAKMIDDLKLYTDESIEYVIENSKVKVIAKRFNYILTAGQTQHEIPYDDFDMNNDIILAFINDMSAEDESTVTQVPGQRAKLILEVRAMDVEVYCVVLKNVISATDNEAVSGLTIIKNTLHPDRILVVGNTLDGSVIKDNTLPAIAIKQTELDAYKYIQDQKNQPIELTDIVTTGAARIIPLVRNYAASEELNFILVDPLVVGKNLAVDIGGDIRSLVSSEGSSITELPEGFYTIYLYAGEPGNPVAPHMLKSSNSKAPITGDSSFNSTTGRVITHNIGSLNYIVHVEVTSDPAGYLGEYWIVKAINTFTVYCSGSTTTTTFTYDITKK